MPPKDLFSLHFEQELTRSTVVAERALSFQRRARYYYNTNRWSEHGASRTQVGVFTKLMDANGVPYIQGMTTQEHLT